MYRVEKNNTKGIYARMFRGMFGSLHDVFFAFGACWGLDMFRPESLGSMAEFPAVSSVVDQLSGARQPITYGNSHGRKQPWQPWHVGISQP